MSSIISRLWRRKDELLIIFLQEAYQIMVLYDLCSHYLHNLHIICSQLVTGQLQFVFNLLCNQEPGAGVLFNYSLREGKHFAGQKVLQDNSTAWCLDVCELFAIFEFSKTSEFLKFFHTKILYLASNTKENVPVLSVSGKSM